VKGKAQWETGSLLDNAIRENALLNVETLRNSEVVLADLIKQNRLHVVGVYTISQPARVPPCPSGSVATLQECFDKAGLIWSSHPQSPVCSNGANLNRK
jgi:hypothetical protein